jgi:hypothetical protein
VSYLFIAIVWTNHHYLMRYATQATLRLLWFNFAHLSSALYRVDGREETGAATGCLLCSGFLPRKRDLHMFDLGAD